jgi:lysine-specific histone demethylase 1
VCAGDPSFWVQASFDCGDLDYEATIIASILSQIGDRPVKPSRPGVNPFLLFTKAKWDECKAHCSRESSSAGRDAIRTTLGKWWKAASKEEKQPYVDQSQAAQELADAARKEWTEKIAQWDIDARRIREECVRDHPAPHGAKDSGLMASSLGGVGVSKRKTNVSNCVVLDHA